VYAIQKELDPGFPVAVFPHSVEKSVVLVAILLEIQTEVKKRLAQDLRLTEQERDEQPTDSYVSVEEGVNRQHNSSLKNIFKGAASTVVMRLHTDPLYEHYIRLTAAGTKPNPAQLTIARRIAAIVLRMWEDEQEYDPRDSMALRSLRRVELTPTGGVALVGQVRSRFSDPIRRGNPINGPYG